MVSVGAIARARAAGDDGVACLDGEGLKAAGEGLTLRAARDSDAPGIIALVRAAWSEIPGKILELQRDAPDLIAPATAYAAGGGNFWVVEQGSRIVGTVALLPTVRADVVEFRRFYITRELRGGGLGAVLCRLFDDEATRRKARMVELWTDTRMYAAHRLYERNGYRRGPERRVCSETGAVRYRYWKLLPGATWRIDRKSGELATAPAGAAGTAASHPVAELT